MFLGKKLEIFHFIPRLSQLSHDCFATKCFSRKPQCVSRLISRLSNSQKMRVFNFSKFPHFPRNASLEPLSTQNQFSLNPIIFKQKSLRNHFKVCFPKHCFHFCLRFYRFQLRVLKFGDFRKRGWGSYFCAICFQNFDWAESHLLCLYLCWPQEAF